MSLSDILSWVYISPVTGGLNIQRKQEKFPRAGQSFQQCPVLSSTQLCSQRALALPEQQALPGEVLLCSSGVTVGKGEVMVVCANPKALLRTAVAFFLCHCWYFFSETCLMGTGHREVCSSVRVEILGPSLGVGNISW